MCVNRILVIQVIPLAEKVHSEILNDLTSLI